MEMSTFRSSHPRIFEFGVIAYLFFFIAVSGTARAEPDANQNAGGDQAIELTLDSCIKLGIESATNILRAKNSIELTGADLIQAYGQFLPNLAVTSGVGASEGRYYNWVVTPVEISERDWGTNLQVSTSVNIFNGLADSASLHSALERKTSAVITLDWARQQIALDVAQIFLQAAYGQRRLALAQENLKVSKGRQELLEAQSKVGLKDLTDLYRQRALTSRDESSVSKIFATQKTDMLALLKRLRLDARKQYKIVEPKLTKPSEAEFSLNENDLIKMALQRRPDLKASEHALAASKSDIEVSKSSYLPRVDFGISAVDVTRQLDTHSVVGESVDLFSSTQRNLGQQFGDQILYNVGITMTWSIFDRDLTKANVQRAKIASKNLEIDTEDVRNSIVVDVRRAFTDYISARDQLRANEAGRTAATMSFQALKGKYEVGAAKFLDVSDSQATLLEAESAEAQSLFQVELQKRVLMTVSGYTGRLN